MKDYEEAQKRCAPASHLRQQQIRVDEVCTRLMLATDALLAHASKSCDCFTGELVDTREGSVHRVDVFCLCGQHLAFARDIHRVYRT